MSSGCKHHPTTESVSPFPSPSQSARQEEYYWPRAFLKFTIRGMYLPLPSRPVICSVADKEVTGVSESVVVCWWGHPGLSVASFPCLLSSCVSLSIFLQSLLVSSPHPTEAWVRKSPKESRRCRHSPPAQHPQHQKWWQRCAGCSLPLELQARVDQGSRGKI